MHYPDSDLARNPLVEKSWLLLDGILHATYHHPSMCLYFVVARLGLSIPYLFLSKAWWDIPSLWGWKPKSNNDSFIYHTKRRDRMDVVQTYNSQHIWIVCPSVILQICSKRWHGSVEDNCFQMNALCMGGEAYKICLVHVLGLSFFFFLRP